MSYEDLMTLINHLDQSTVEYVDYQTDTQHVILSKKALEQNGSSNPGQTTAQAELATQATNQNPQPSNETAATETKTAVSTAESAEEDEAASGEVVVAPMVGVVYLQPNPDADLYVSVGDRVEQGDVICIVEAMKIMNEIQAPRGGVVTEILVENEEVVEYEQPLIRID